MRRIAVALLLALAACAQRQQAYQPRIAPPALTADAFLPGDGATLPLRSWMPEGKVRAAIVALHGFNDYGHAFALPGEYFAARGVALYAYDQRGFGAATEPGVWAGEDNLADDAARMLEAVRARHPQAKLFLLGESMGGAVGLSALAREDAPEVDGVILSAPAVWGGEYMPWAYRAPLWLLAHASPGWELTGEDVEVQATDNMDVLREMGRDPLVLKSTRADAVLALLKLMDGAYAAHPAPPALLLYGERDEVIPREPVDAFAARAHGLSMRRYPEGYHMLLRDRQRERVYADMLKWIKATGNKKKMRYAMNP